MSYSPGGYSWLALSPEPKNVPMTEKEKNRLNRDLDEMERAAIALEENIRRYHQLCKEYEVAAGTDRGAKLFEEIELLKEEIKRLSKEIKNCLNASFEE